MSDYDSAAKKVALRARMDPLFGRVLAADPRRAIENAYFLSSGEKRAFAEERASPSGGRPRITGAQARAMVKLSQKRRADPLFARALALDGLSVLRDAPSFSGEDRQAIHTFASEQGVQSIEEWHRRITLEHRRQTPALEQTTVVTEPYARCVIGHLSLPDRERRTVRADGNGLIRLSMSAEAVLNLANGKLPVFCEEGGSSYTVRPIDYPAKTVRPRNATGEIRPALTASETVRLSNEELIARNYPPRPDPAVAPDAHAHWLRTVTSPQERLRAPENPPPSGNSNYSVIPAQNNSWAGWGIVNPGAAITGMYGYQWVTGVLWTPPVYMPTDDAGAIAKFSMWVGLNGWGPTGPPCLQAGIHLDLYNIPIFWPFEVVIHRYYSWVQ